MANISEEKWIEMLEKKADGTYIAKYPKVKSKSGVTFDEHLADYATLEKAGHVKAETDEEGKLVLDVPKSNYNATEPPTANDDESKGYTQGSMWFVSTDTSKMGYICISDEVGNAIWQLVGSESTIGLYEAGNEFEHITGGWSLGFTTHTSNTLEKTSSGIILNHGGYGRGISVATNNSISLKGIDEVSVLCSATGADTTTQIIISLGRDEESTIVALVSERGAFSSQVLNIDVRGLNGNYYIAVVTRSGLGTSSIKGGTSIYSVYLS